MSHELQAWSHFVRLRNRLMEDQNASEAFRADPQAWIVGNGFDFTIADDCGATTKFSDILRSPGLADEFAGLDRGVPLRMTDPDYQENIVLNVNVFINVNLAANINAALYVNAAYQVNAYVNVNTEGPPKSDDSISYLSQSVDLTDEYMKSELADELDRLPLSRSRQLSLMSHIFLGPKAQLTRTDPSDLEARYMFRKLPIIARASLDEGALRVRGGSVERGN